MNIKLQLKRYRKFLKQVKRKEKYRKKKYKLSILPRKLKEYKLFRENAISKRIPQIFSIKENIEETLAFISGLKKIKSPKKDIFFNMYNVSVIDEGTIALFVSLIKELTAKKYRIRGNKPKNRNARKILEKSGFFEHLNGVIDEENKYTSNTILTEGKSKTEQEETAKIVRKAIKFLTGKEDKNPPLQRLFVELMANTINHGFKNVKNAKWYLSYSEEHNNSEKICKFAFVDNGTGIVETLKLKNIFQELNQRIISLFKGDYDLLLSAFEGKIGSRTGLDYRGKGLPEIYKAMENNIISNLFILTNEVILDFKNNDYRKININHRGTFYYFELSNKNLKKNDK